jgi:hypothetical protein
MLVVSGILVALQINNWNNSRNEKKLEYKILQDLKVEFKANHQDATRMYETHLSFISAMNTLQELYVSEDYDQMLVDSQMIYLFYIGSYTPRPGASDNLINSGNLSLIANEDLRNKLTVWSGIVEDLYDDENEAKTYTLNSIIPFLAKNYPITNIEINERNLLMGEDGWLEKGKFPVDDWYAKDSFKKSLDIKKLLSNVEFQGHVSAKKLFAIHCITEASEVVEAAQEIIKLIDSEINSKEND